MPTATGSRLAALARNPRALALAGAAAVGVIYLRRSGSSSSATDATLQGDQYPVDPSTDSSGSGLGAASGSFGDTPSTGTDQAVLDALTGISDQLAGLQPLDAPADATPPASVPAGPNAAATAAGFWWGGKFWRNRKDWEAWAKTHGVNLDRWYSNHPAAAQAIGVKPPPAAAAQPSPAHVAAPAAHVPAHKPTLPHPASKNKVTRVATLAGGVRVHTKPASAKPRHALPQAVRKATPKIDPNHTAAATAARGRAHGGALFGPAATRKVAVTAGPAARELAKPAGNSTQPHREVVKAAVKAKPKPKPKPAAALRNALRR